MVGLDAQGWLTLAAGLLLALITLFTGYDHVDVPGLGAIQLDQQIGVSLLLASLATLVGDAQLASRRRLRDQSDRVREAQDRIREARDRAREAQDRARAEDAAARERDLASEERDRAAEERERAARRARRQDRCTLAQLDFQLNPNPTSRTRLSDLMALLREYGEFG